jgi:ATP-dependent RNA helicase DDX19/DBP5
VQVNLVINYDIPVKYETLEPDYEVYLQRSSKAGHFGPRGEFFIFQDLFFPSQIQCLAS